MDIQNHYPYHINIFYNAEDGDYIADVPDFKYVSAFGDTPEAALHEVLIALDMTIEVLQEQGKPLPEASYRPAYLTE
ncbi:MAG: type II toxin-antitoxin system HicB family antitoxin [Chloroflexi bacterium]|nr:type II toxin-antitoxin system HicB family antitoxin [Chloroflexota bacterium]MCC6895321.1 type II toxin-antitoxin system HicB family antitoxin [Anaerolineae bacterium]